MVLFLLQEAAGIWCGFLISAFRPPVRSYIAIATTLP
jgi:hypothetical protein